MGKKILAFLLLAAIAAIVAGCSNPDEPDIDVPVAKPGDPNEKFSPSGVQAPGGGGGAPTAPNNK